MLLVVERLAEVVDVALAVVELKQGRPALVVSLNDSLNKERSQRHESALLFCNILALGLNFLRRSLLQL